ncbi:MAG: site-2 protease family protein [Candidatus Helarchaeota archaeon]
MDDFSILYPVALSLDELRKIVEKEFVIKKDYFALGTNIPTFIVERIEDPKKLSEAFNKIQKEVEKKNIFGLLREIPKSERIDVEIKKFLSLKFFPMKKRGPSRVWINFILLIATCLTVLLASYFILLMDPLYFPDSLNSITGILFLIGYAIAIMGIIGIHELGHLIAARHYGIKSTLPYFIPFAPPIGTMGAIIIQKTPPKNRNELFDLGLAGPLAGFIIALIVGLIGFLISGTFLKMDYISSLHTIYMQMPSWLVGPPVNDWVNVSNTTPDPIIFYIFSWILIKNPPAVSPTALNLIAFNNSTMYVNVLHSISFAAWIGFFVTGLNLMPISQLDGGHVSRALFGEKYYKYVAYIALFILFLINFIFAILVLAFSRFNLTHPGPLNDVTPLSKSRKIASIVFFVILLLTIPIGSILFMF